MGAVFSSHSFYLVGRQTMNKVTSMVLAADIFTSVATELSVNPSPTTEGRATWIDGDFTK